MKDKIVSKFESINELDFTISSDIWTKENLFKATKLFQERGSEEDTVEILEKLIKINVSNVPSEIGIELQDFIYEIVKRVSISSFAEKYQMTMILFINQCPYEILRMLINKYFIPQLNDDNINILLTTGRGISVSITRRLYESPIVETIANMVTYIIKCPEVVTELEHKLEEENSQRRFEIHSVTKAVLLKNNESDFYLIENLVNKLIGELDGNDILSSLASLTILSEIASEREIAAFYLGQKGLIEKIYNNLTRMKEEKDNIFLYFGYIKFFGHLVSVNPNYLKKYPIFVESILGMFDNFEELGNDEKILAISTFGAIFHSSESKKFLFEIDDIKNNLSKIMGTSTKFLLCSNMETRIHVIDSFVMLFQNYDLKDTNIFEKILDLCGSDFTTLLIDILKSPLESRYAVQHLILNLIDITYGFKKIYFTPTFLEYLLDRTSETNLIGMQAKHDIISKIIENYFEIVGEANVNKLKEYIKNYPRRREAIPDVALMG
uniref:26S proteasome non-ATPase regulatory subunit 5 n=2 Tax=Strongyloides papillosus TaxID=174720 RepID=A0A0N5BYL6_STREA